MSEDEAPTRPFSEYREYPPEEMLERARRFHADAERRRSVREFSDRPVARELIEAALKAANTAPSGANMQPWHFVAISGADTKRRIRLAAEEEERAFYGHRASDEWLDALKPFGTDANKPFLETAPWLIAIFLQKFSADEHGEKVKHYYPTESTGLASGILITALHEAGLATLTHTPSPMKFLNEILGRPKTERPFLLLVVGYPADDCEVPDIKRKALDEFASFIDE